MPLDMILVFAVLIGALVLFALEAFTVDFIAFGVMALLMGLSLVTPEQGISGFANTATITVMAMFILSSGLYRTGAIDLLTDKMLKFAKGGETRQLLLVMITVGPISAFLNNTAAVAILIPFAVRIAREHNRSPSKLLMPLSFTSQLAGVVTLLGTSTNILASSISAKSGFGGFGVFEFSLIGLVVLAIGVLYLLTVGRALIPQREVPHSAPDRFKLKQYLSEAVIPEDSSFVGKTLHELKLPSKYGLEVAEIVRAGRQLREPLVHRTIQANDRLIIRANAQELTKLENLKDIALPSESEDAQAAIGNKDTVLAEVIIAPGSRLIGSSLKELDFRNRFGASVLAMSKQGRVVRRLPSTPLGLGDSLLLKAPPGVMASLKADESFIVTDDLDHVAQRPNKIPVAVGIVVGVVVVAGLQLQPILVSALEGCVLMVLTGCLKIRELHESIRWDVIFLLAGIIPLGIAMENTGAAQLIADQLVALSQYLPPILLLGLVYLATTLLTELISNTATVVLLVPIVGGMAVALGLDPRAFVLAVMFAASTSFMTPVGYQTNTMVFGPGGYKFLDYFRVGAPLNLLLLFATTLTIAFLWGF